MVGLRQQAVQRHQPARLSDDSDDDQFAIPARPQADFGEFAQSASSEISSDESVTSVIINQKVNVAVSSDRPLPPGKFTSKIINFDFICMIRCSRRDDSIRRRP